MDFKKYVYSSIVAMMDINKSGKIVLEEFKKLD